MVSKGRKREEYLREYRINFQVSATEKKKLEEIARRKGITVSDYIRQKTIYEPFDKIYGIGENKNG